jgi:hypothetical protein
MAALSVHDAAITGEIKSLHGNFTERLQRRAKEGEPIFSRSVLRYVKVLVALGVDLGCQLGYAETPSAKENPITAIDIALEPDATMIQHAEAVNARLREVFPKGFALDATTIRTFLSCSGTFIRRTSTKSTTPSARSWTTRGRLPGA